MARPLHGRLRRRRLLALASLPALLAGARACLLAFASPGKPTSGSHGPATGGLDERDPKPNPPIRNPGGLDERGRAAEAVGSLGGATDERKVRSAIESIMLDQETLRRSTPLLSARTVFAACSSAGLAGLAAAASTLPAWGAVLLPALTSGIFIYTSVAESSSSRSKGLAKCSSAAALGLATQQESVLALAEEKKAFLPFGAGLTAIFAAACVTLKILEEEEVGTIIPLTLFGGISADDVFLFMLLLASVACSVVTSDRCISMQAALTLKPEERRRDDSTSEWESRRLPDTARDPDPALRVLVIVLTLSICLLPALATAAADSAGSFEQVSVVMSATAAAWSAWVLLVAEKDFADAERRIAIQAKQAALADLFAAQAEAEAAVLPVATAVSGAALGGATLAVEFSMAAATLLAWPAVASTVRSSVGAVMTRLEAAASFLELQRSKKGPGNQRPSDSISSSLRELNRLQAEFGFDRFSNEVRERLQQLPAGSTEDFKRLSRQDRRQVHIVAAELGMESQSFGSTRQRVVMVTNSGAGPPDDASQAALPQDLWASLQDELRAAAARGVPAASRPAVLLAAAGTLGSLAAPLVLARGVAELLVPLATSGVGLATVWQETDGKTSVAAAKQRTANLMQRQSEAEVQIGRATMSYAALPTAFAVTNLAMTSAIIGLAHGSCRWVPYAVVFALPLAAVTAAISWQRCKKVERYVAGAARLIGVKPPAQRMVRARRWWWAPVALAALVPCHLSQRLAIACALFVAELGLLMALAARRLAWGTYRTARCGVSCASADAWSQQAQSAVRRLPVESAVAITGTLLSTAVVAFSLPLSLAFPVLGFSVFVRAVQFRAQAQESASRANSVCDAPEDLRRPWPWASKAMAAAAPVGPQGSAAGLIHSQPRGSQGPSVGWLSLLAPQLQRAGDKPQSFSLRRTVGTFLGLWDVRPPEQEYDLNPAERAVENIQADLDEARISMRSNERNWLRMLSFVAAIATGAILIPFLLPEIGTEVALPVAGTVLPILAASAESDARRGVATAKVRAAELCAAIQRTHRLLATATLPRAGLIGGAGFSCAAAAVLLVLEHPLGFSPRMQCLQHALQIVLTIVQIALSAWCVLPLREVLLLTADSRRITADVLRGSSSSWSLPPLRLGDPNPGRRHRARWHPWMAAAALLPTLLAFFPRSRSMAQRTVASGAAAGFVLAFALLIAEAATARAELTMARRARAFALTDAFSNEAEQQSALLPLASAGTIAISGLITFGTELNPFAASAFVLLQVATWVLASRKAVATKFETTAAMQVDSVAKYGTWRLGSGGGQAARRAAGALVQ